VHALLIALMTVGIIVAVSGFFTAVFGGLVAERLRLGLLGLAPLGVGLTLAITTGAAGRASPAASAHPSASHLGYGKF
jgi:cadmium resistance protein CadD (predicted permease)